MDIKEEFKEQICRDIVDSLNYFCDIDVITLEQEKSLLDSFYKFIHVIDKVFDEVK